MKKHPLLLFILIWSLSASAQETKYDTAAIFILDHMSDVIGDLSSCSYTLRTSVDDLSSEGLGLVTHFSTHEVMLEGPNKMQVNSNGDKGHRGYWYNGEQLAFYSYDENNYSILEAPSTILETIDTLHAWYGIDFPAADFFYPTFTDDLIGHSDKIVYLGKSMIEGKACFRILATNKETITQLWISDDALTLPYKLLIIYKGKENGGQYEATFTNWLINPELPFSVFEFLPPPEASEIEMLPK